MEVDGGRVSARLAAKLAEALARNAYLEVAVDELQAQLLAVQQANAQLQQEYQPKHTTALEAVPDE